MPNEFEKIVQQKMDELKLVPSEPVWQKVEMQIRKKKDRRRLIFWIPLMALLLGGGLWIGIDYYSNDVAYHKLNDEAQKQSSITKTTNKTETIVTTQKGIDKKSPQTKKQNINTTSTNTSEKKNNENSVSKNEGELNSGLKTSSTSISKGIFESKPIERTKEPKEKRVVEEGNTLSDHDETVSINNESREIVVRHEVQRINWVVSSFDIAKSTGFSNAFTFDSVQMKPTIVFQDSVKQDTASAQKPETKKLAKSNWKLNVVASSGVSGSSRLNFLNFFNGDKSLAAPSYSNGGSTGGFYYGSSPIKKGFAFSVGALAKKQLGYRTSFFTGLQYNYYSNTINVGTVVNQSLRVMDFTVAQYYSNAITATHPYRNQYHFVSVPLIVDWQIFKKIPLNFHTGLSLQYLIKTNALRFDYNTQSYFYNKKAFNRIDLVSDFGFDYSVSLKQKPLIFGPDFQYGLSRLEKGNSANHLFSYGVKAQWQLSKK